eukprot:m.149523 g.149523  ORF g.149523 m.149523 type:complete len:53 (+) comp17818_c0_seq2:274-432(+)
MIALTAQRKKALVIAVVLVVLWKVHGVILGPSMKGCGDPDISGMRNLIASLV